MEKYSVAELRESCNNRSVPITNSDGSMKVKKDLIKSLQKYVLHKQLGGARKRSSRRRSRRKSSLKTRSRSRRKSSRKLSRKSRRKSSRKTRRKSRRKSSRRSRRRSMTGGAVTPQASPVPLEGETDFLQKLFKAIYSGENPYIENHFTTVWSPEKTYTYEAGSEKRVKFNSLHNRYYGRSIFGNLTLTQRSPRKYEYFRDVVENITKKNQDRLHTLQIQIKLISNSLFIYLKQLKKICNYFKDSSTVQGIVRTCINDFSILINEFLETPAIVTMLAIRTFLNDNKDIELHSKQITLQNIDVIYFICELYPYQDNNERVTAYVVDYLFEALNLLNTNNKHNFQKLVEFELS